MTHGYIFVTGGVISGLGKGITAASIGRVLQSEGFKVTAIKIDPYLNYDAGTLRPTEHGEVWVTEDGGEIDQDLGHYERFLDVTMGKKNNITTGQVYKEVIEKERRGEYLWKTVQIIPHLTDEIKRRIRETAKISGADFVIVEIGGVVGDYENIPFLEAARQMRMEEERIIFVHVGYLPVLQCLGEMKTKPMQHSVKELRELGIQPDFIVCRSEEKMDEVRKEKIAMFCNVRKEDIIANPNLDIVYELPLVFEEQNFGERILSKLGMTKKKSDLDGLRAQIDQIKKMKSATTIGIVGKYFSTGDYNLADSYISVIEAARHAAWSNGVSANFKWIDAQALEHGDKEGLNNLKSVNGIIVPGGFGSSGVEGKIKAIQLAREKNIPLLGLCFGFQLAVIEFARNVIGLKDAHSTEIDPYTKHPVICLLQKQKEILSASNYGNTMRLGGQAVLIKKGSLAHKLYGRDETVERFRHRYEVNPEFVGLFEEKGFVFSGKSKEEDAIMQIGELPKLKFFLGTQFHPEFTSRFAKPNPLFFGFVKASIEK